MNVASHILNRPGLYIPIFDQEVTPRGTAISFLDFPFGSPTVDNFSVPFSSTVHVAHQSFSLSSQSRSKMITEDDFRQLDRILDLTDLEPSGLGKNYQTFGLSSLQPIVWLSEYCVFDISQCGMRYTRLFRNGFPSGEAQVTEVPLSAISTVNLLYAVRHDVFTATMESYLRMKEALEQWANRFLSQKLSTDVTSKTSWDVYSEYVYTLYFELSKE
jgi:hypothetical protein